MKRSLVAKCLIVTLVMLGTSSVSQAAYNVATRFADVIMEYVNPGQVYNLRTMRNLPYRVINKSNGPVDLEVSVEIPQTNELKPDYEAIPDPSWIHLIPSRIHLNEGEEGLVDIIVQVPAGTSDVGHHFQAHIVCRTAQEKGPSDGNNALTFGIALASRLRFSVGSAGPNAIRLMQKKGIYQMLNFTLEPDSQYVPGFVEIGKTIALKNQGTHLSLINRSPQKLQFSLKSVQAPDNVAPPSGYHVGDPSWITVKPPTLKVAGEAIKGADLDITIPNDPKYRGQRFMFVIQAGLEGREIPVEVFSRVYVNVQQ